MLFLYQSDKSMNISLESELERNIRESNMTQLKEFMDFSLLIREENQEINEEQNLTKKWFTGYISLLNLTINNGTNDLSLDFNEELNGIINSINNGSNLRNLDEISDTQKLNNETELCFVKINFYENGEIKDIFYPKEFDLDNMVYINKITEFIIPKLSKNLYTENIKEEIARIEKLLDGSDEEEEEEIFYNEEKTDFGIELQNFEDEENVDSDEIFLDEKNNDIFLRRISENDTFETSFIEDSIDIIDFSDTNHIDGISDIINNDDNDDSIYSPLNEDDLEIDNINQTSNDDDSFKYILKGIEENATHSTIIDFQNEFIESEQAKLEGSKLRRIKNTFLDEKGQLVYIIETESIVVNQPNKESLNDLTEEEEKLKSEIFTDNNYFQRNDS